MLTLAVRLVTNSPRESLRAVECEPIRFAQDHLTCSNARVALVRALYAAEIGAEVQDCVEDLLDAVEEQLGGDVDYGLRWLPTEAESDEQALADVRAKLNEQREEASAAVTQHQTTWEQLAAKVRNPSLPSRLQALRCHRTRLAVGNGCLMMRPSETVRVRD